LTDSIPLASLIEKRMLLDAIGVALYGSEFEVITLPVKFHADQATVWIIASVNK
jgi:Zn-dependent membrane protease YugP